MAGPRNGLQTLAIDLFAARHAFSEAAFTNPRERSVDHIEQLPVVVALAEKKFLVVRTGGAVGDVLRGLIVRGTAVLLIAGHHLAQFLPPGFQSFPESL